MMMVNIMYMLIINDYYYDDVYFIDPLDIEGRTIIVGIVSPISHN